MGLLLLPFTSEELSTGNCTKPVQKDIRQLDSERLWAITLQPHLENCTGHVDYLSMTGSDEASTRWANILTKTLNPKCRQLRSK